MKSPICLFARDAGRGSFLVVLLLMTMAFVASCGSANNDQENEQQLNDQPGGNGAETVGIRVAVLPILDALPMYAADELGFFEEQNLQVEFIPVPSASERDQIIQAGRADAMINEILSTLFYNSQDQEIVIVRNARVATPQYPQFRILAASDSGIRNLDDLKGREIGISEATIIEYSTDRLLESEGFTAEEINTIAVPRIPDRMALLSSGELVAANLPDPLSSLAVQNGAVVIIDDSQYPQFGHSTISFRSEFVEDNPQAVAGFLQAIEKAVKEINLNKEQFNELLIERQLVPESLIGSYVIPDFPLSSVPPRSQWDDILDWAKDKGYITADLAYDDSVDSSFLP